MGNTTTIFESRNGTLTKHGDIYKWNTKAGSTEVVIKMDNCKSYDLHADTKVDIYTPFVKPSIIKLIVGKDKTLKLDKNAHNDNPYAKIWKENTEENVSICNIKYGGDNFNVYFIIKSKEEEMYTTY
jgi:hypothetical protein